MNWKSTAHDPLPAHQQEVLISVNGVYYFASFDAGSSAFSVSTEKTKQIFKIHDQLIYWCEVE